jgi:hypothetical protein
MAGHMAFPHPCEGTRLARCSGTTDKMTGAHHTTAQARQTQICQAEHTRMIELYTHSRYHAREWRHGAAIDILSLPQRSLIGGGRLLAFLIRPKAARRSFPTKLKLDMSSSEQTNSSIDSVQYLHALSCCCFVNWSTFGPLAASGKPPCRRTTSRLHRHVVFGRLTPCGDIRHVRKLYHCLSLLVPHSC